MRKLSQAATAEQDLEAILAALDAYNPASAAQFVSDFDARARLLRSQPRRS